MVGQKSIDFSLLSLQRLAELGLRPVMKDGLVPGIYRWATHQPSRTDLLHALHIGRNCRASDARDKVFGLLGLLDSNIDEPLKPDYGLTIAEVYIQTAAHAIISQNTLAVLSYASYDAGSTDYTPIDPVVYTNIRLPEEWAQWRRVLRVAKKREYHDIPSWVPNWSLSTYSEPLKPYYGVKHPMERTGKWHCNESVMSFAAGKSFQKTEVTSTSFRSLSVLAVFAIQLDSVNDGVRYSDIDDWMRSSGIEELIRIDPYGQHVSRLPIHLLERSCYRTKHFWSRITGDSISDPKVGNTQYPSVFIAQTACHCIQGGPHSGAHEDFDDAEVEAFESESALQGDGRVLFRTKDSLVLGPPSTRPGDTIWRLQGAAVPFILRRMDGNQYTVIGECYLHGAIRLEGCYSSELNPCERCSAYSTTRKDDCGIPQMIELH
jgi:hypothetical protein